MNKGNSLRLNNFQSKSFRKIILNLRYYFRFNFFKEIVNVLVIVLKKKNSEFLLADFIAFQFSTLKNHNLFLRFLKQTISQFIYSNISSLNGLKFSVKGRINGVPRSSVKTFLIGELPIQSYNKNIRYAESVSYTSNGTLGFKIWLF